MTSINPEVKKKAESLLKSRFRHADLSHALNKLLFKLSAVETVAKLSELEAKAVESYTLFPVTSYTPEDLADNPISLISASKLMKNKIDLPSLPNIFSEIVEIMSDPTSSAQDFADIIIKDPALSVQLLKIVNSAFYGFRSRVDTISRAVSIIGTNDLYALTLSMSVLKMFEDIPESLVDMQSFWSHCIACGILAKIMAGCIGYSNTERFFVAGLLHDIGRLVLFKYMPTHEKKAMIKAGLTDELLNQSELNVLGFSHSRIGGMLMKKWHLPPKLDQMVRYHHSPEESSFLMDTAVVHVSDIISNSLSFGTSGERFVPPLSADAWQTLGLSIELIEQTIQQTKEQISEVSQILLPHSDNT